MVALATQESRFERLKILKPPALPGDRYSIGFEALVEAPDQPTNAALRFALLIRERVELVNQTFGMNLILSSR